VHYGPMKTASDLIDLFGGSSELARRINVPIPTVGAWKFRGSIPPEHFPQLVALAKELRIRGVTYEALYSMRTEKA
jgi:hypothetical protein